MPASELRLIKRCAEFRPRDDVKLVPRNTRGIYVLLDKKSKKQFDVIYVWNGRRSKSWSEWKDEVSFEEYD